MKVDARTMDWIRKPNECDITEDKVTITTEPFTDLWQRTYYHFRNDNAPILQMKSEEQFFYEGADRCGDAMKDSL